MQSTPQQYQSLQWAARYRGIRRLLRRSAIGAIIFGLISIVLGFVTLQLSSLNIILIILGIALFAQAALSYILPRPWVFIMEGILFVSLGGWNIMVTILNAAAGERPRSFLPILAIFQIGWGILAFKRYGEYRDVPNDAPPEDMLNWLNSMADTLRKTKPEQDASVIEFTAQRQFPPQAVIWRGRLTPDSITLTDKGGAEVLILDRNGLSITPGKAVMLRKDMLNAQIVLDGKKYKGIISQASYERFAAWQQGGRAVQGDVWVPRA